MSTTLHDFPLISLILAARNAEKFISTSVDSVLNQTYSNWELIIINNGSSDETGNIIKKYADKRIRCYNQPNEGVSKARNLGLELMKGDYFCFLDSDDQLPANSIESRLFVFGKDERTDFVDGGVIQFDQWLTRRIRIWQPDFTGNPRYNLISQNGRCFFGNTWMIKRKPGLNYSFEEKLTHGEDLLFYLSICSDHSMYNYSRDIILHYRTGHKSAMSDLIGLERGYNQIYHMLQGDKSIPSAWLEKYRKKTKSILFRSYFGNLHFKKGIEVLFKKW